MVGLLSLTRDERCGDDVRCFCRRLYDNSLTGVIPTQIGALTALAQYASKYPVMQVKMFFPTSQRAHSGEGFVFSLTLFADDGACSWLSDNSLNGTIPTEIGKLTAMTVSMHIYCPFSLPLLSSGILFTSGLACVKLLDKCLL